MSKVKRGDPIDPASPSRLRVTIFSRRLLGLNTCCYLCNSTYIIVLPYKMMFPSCFQQNLLILSKISKIENLVWRPSLIFFVAMAIADN